MAEPWESEHVEKFRCDKCGEENDVEKLNFAAGYRTYLCVPCENEITLRMMESKEWSEFVMAFEELGYMREVVCDTETPPPFTEIVEPLRAELKARLGLFKFLHKLIARKGK